MILLTGLYHEPNAARRAELRECLRRNAANDLIEAIHLFNEESVSPKEWGADPLLSLEKVRVLPHGRRLTFQDCFDYSNQHLTDRNVIVANADIYFDASLALLGRYDFAGKLLCLSRWDVQADGTAKFFEHPASQDAWVFRTPIRGVSCNICFGVPGCENRLAWEAQLAGLKLSNPGRTIRANHLHLSQVRNYTEGQRVRGNTETVPASFLETPYPSARGPAPEAGCARVAFRETMGCTVARLGSGVSSHNNEFRPFKAIPEALNGLIFIQAVACVVSPVEVEFLSAGKAYVLVGTDWAGHQTNTEWLDRNGFREPLPLVETHAKTGFEVWSLIGTAGDRFVIPTQVIVAAADLARNEGRQTPPPSQSQNVVTGGRLARCLLIAARHNCGLWSSFFQVVGLIRYAERHGLEPVVYFNAAACWWSPDGYNGSHNAWEYFFDPISGASALEVLGAKAHDLEGATAEQIQAACPELVVRSDYILDCVGHYDHTEEQRQEYADIIARRIKLKSRVLAKLDAGLVHALASGATAVHYRGTDKSCESPRQSVHEYRDAIEHRVDRAHMLFVATDEKPFLDWMIGTYGDRVLYAQAVRSQDRTSVHLGPHRGPQRAEECLLDVILMSKCRHLVHGNSSVTNGVLAFNPAMSHEALHLDLGS